MNKKYPEYFNEATNTLPPELREKPVDWVPYNEHDELVRAVADVERLEKESAGYKTERDHYWDQCEKLFAKSKRYVVAVNDLTAEVERLQAVVDAAILFCHHDIAGHHGPNEYHRKKSRKNLFDEVAAFEEDQL